MNNHASSATCGAIFTHAILRRMGCYFMRQNRLLRHGTIFFRP